MNKINFNNKKRLAFVASLFSLFVLQSCNNEDMPNNQKVDRNIEGVPVELSINIDNTYEYDDNNTRAVQFTAEDSPKVVMTEAEFTTLDPDNGSPKLGFNNTILRFNWIAFQHDNNNRVGQEVVNMNKFANRKIKIENTNNKTTVKLWVDFNNLATLENKPNATWFGQMIIGGFPGKPIGGNDERLIQHFTKFRDGNGNANEFHIDASPNHRIDELDPQDGSMARRHFPLVGDITPMSFWNKPNGGAGNYDGTHNTGQIGLKENMEIKARGSIFTFTLDNQTGQEIEVTHIEVPVRGSRGTAFSFEGRFSVRDLHPFSGGVLSKEGCIPIFQRQDYRKLRQTIDAYGLPQGIEKPEASPESFRFPLYRIGGQANIPLSIGQQSRGRFMVWAYAHQPELGRPFTVRVRYTSNGQEYISKAQIVTPPDGGFKEGKAYRSLLKIEL